MINKTNLNKLEYISALKKEKSKNLIFLIAFTILFIMYALLFCYVVITNNENILSVGILMLMNAIFYINFLIYHKNLKFKIIECILIN